jgi:P27 family predicted phage terminase small subunit
MTRRRPKPPEHLDEQAKVKWAETLPALPDVEPGTLDALAAYATAWSRMVAAEAKVAELGPVVKSPQGFPQINPYLQVLAQERRAVRQWAEELKLTPKARGRKRADDDEPADPVLRLIRRAPT